MQLIFATQNPHKLKEINSLLKGKFIVKGLSDLNWDEELPEHHQTLEENAIQKAREVFTHTRQPCFSDDTGLEVDVLKGAPGVYSARFALRGGELLKGEDISTANIIKLLGLMQGARNRSAQFRTVIALVTSRGERMFEGTVRGRILDAPRGEQGFGYDPVFLPEGHQKSFAEMPLSEKNKISHRARALHRLVDFLIDEGQELL